MCVGAFVKGQGVIAFGYDSATQKFGKDFPGNIGFQRFIKVLNFTSIVFLGNFNPAIYHPEWLEKFKILPIQEIQWAEGEKTEMKEIPYKNGTLVLKKIPPLMVTPDLTELFFPSLRLTVNSERFECSTEERRNFSLVKDVVIKIFSLLSHTPIKAVGINFHAHWKFKDPSDVILKNLFAKNDSAFQNSLGPDYHIGGTIWSIQKGVKSSLKIEKSNKLDNGVYIQANYHKDIETIQTEQPINFIQENYDDFINQFIEESKKILGDPEETWKMQQPKK